MDYPPNSKSKVAAAPQDKKIERVTSADVTRRNKPLGRQFRDTFVTVNAKTALQTALLSVLIPAAKDALYDAGSRWLEVLMFGESRNRRGRGPASGPTGYVSYSDMSRPSNQHRSLSKRARSRHDFDEIVLESRTEAEDVLESLFELLSKYKEATVADLYDLTGLDSSHTDHRWGWTDLRGASVVRLRNQGYLLDLPEPESLG